MKYTTYLLLFVASLLLLAACSPTTSSPETAVNDAMTDDAMADDTMADDTMSDDTMSDDDMSDDTMSDDTMSDDTMSDDDMSDDTMTDDAMSDDDMTDDAMSDDDMSDDTMTDDDMSDDDMSDDDMSDDTMSDDDMSDDTMTDDDMTDDTMSDDDMSDDDMITELAPWQTIPLTNAATGATFTLGDYTGKTVFVEPMATWCTNCRQQLGNVAAARAALGDEEIVWIALSVETNISNQDLVNYMAETGFDWTFAVATPELLQELAATFGQTVANPPATPHFVIWPDGTTSELATGYESPDELIAKLQG